MTATTIEALKPAWSEWKDGMDSPIYAADGVIVLRKADVREPYKVRLKRAIGGPTAIWYVSPADYHLLLQEAGAMSANHVREPRR